MKQYHIVDLFAGVGGLSYGFSQLPGFRILAANEIEKDIAAAYSLNHPGVKMLNCDIADLTKERLAGALGGQQVDIVVGGPPCQSYSTLGKRRMDDRANLFLQYKRILQILQPQAFIFENVTGILSMDHGRLFQRVESEFRALGYDVRHDILNAVDFGVPQQRERVILVGMKGENNYIFPVPTHGPGKKPYVTLKDAIGDLPQLKSGESASHYAGVAENEFLRFVRAGAGQLVTEHAAPKNGAHLIRIMQTLQDGQSKDNLPEEIRPKSGYGNTYAKLWWERPSTTITRNFACPSSSRCIHPRDSRAMSIREGARLQSFPDDYRFYGSDGMKRLEIGNAVPPLLSVAIAQEMQSALKRKEQMPERSDPMRLTDQQIEETYRLIEQHHQEFLVSQGVRLPRLRQAGQYTKYALTLVYLAQGYPHTRTVSKKELTEFIRQYYPDVNDVQQARHLGAQQGWCILSGERNDLASEGMKSGEYRLQTLEECYPGFTAERFLLYMASLRRMPRARALERIDWALGAVGLSDVRGKTIRSLSGGMKQRLLLAQAILDEPDILILDEPTAGLDPRQRIAVRNLIAEIALQKIVIVSTHVVPDVEYVASELLLLSEGRLLRKASPAELTHELAGQVWEAELAESELPAAQAAGTVCGIARVDAGHIRVRLLAEKQPPFACRPLAPELEDVYLHYFGAEDGL